MSYSSQHGYGSSLMFCRNVAVEVPDRDRPLPRLHHPNYASFSTVAIHNEPPLSSRQDPTIPVTRGHALIDYPPPRSSCPGASRLCCNNTTTHITTNRNMRACVLACTYVHETDHVRQPPHPHGAEDRERALLRGGGCAGHPLPGSELPHEPGRGGRAGRNGHP